VGTEENYITFSGLGELKNAWNGVKVGERAEGKFRYCAFYNGYGALSFIKAKSDIANCTFINNKTGLAFEANKKGMFNKLSFIYNTKGFFAVRPDSIDYTNLLFYENVRGLSFYGPGVYKVFNSIFTKNINAFSAVFNLKGYLENCEFDQNAIAVRLSGEKTYIRKCNFSNSYMHDISIASETNASNSQAAFTDNNFFSTCNYNVYYMGYSWGSNILNLHAENNFWNGLVDSLQIADNIYDKSDAENNALYTGCILFWPPASHEIVGAGILNAIK